MKTKMMLQVLAGATSLLTSAQAAPALPPVHAPAVFRADYGQRVAASDRAASSSDIWWCESARKVGRARVMPPANTRAAFVPLRLARNEYEAIQIVAQPTKTVRNVTVRAGTFRGPKGATLDAKNLTIDQVEYVGVRYATDRLGAVGEWPDPLPPVKAPLTLQGGINHPFWITAFAPKGIPAGVYQGSIEFSGEGWKRTVPLHIGIWDFALTDETHIRSGLGLTPGRIAPYHNVKGDELLKVLDLYLDNFARHRISSYYPQYGHDIKVDWGDNAQVSWPGGTLDKAQLYNGSESLRVTDDDKKGAPASFSPRIGIKPGQKYQLKWAARTAVEGQTYRVTLETFDVNGSPRGGGNADFAKAGSTTWTMNSEEVTEKLNVPQIGSVRVALRPANWTPTGEQTGTAWFDEVQLLNEAGEDMFKGSGNFAASKKPVSADQVKLDFSVFDRRIEEAIEKWHINGFRVALEGGFVGSHDSFVTGSLQGYNYGSPEFDTLFGSYLRQLQAHLEAKGWLDKAYIYWADEPRPVIFPQLSQMAKTISSHAPKLKWLLTLNNPKDPLLHQVDIWVPIIHVFDADVAAQRKAQGKESWWYISTEPKAPYVGEFIDRPGTDSRLWLWQAWQNKVDGILIWTTVLWDSRARYPDSLQNPWEDPMSWTGGGKGAPWGNGDGRYLYPPNRNPNTDKRPFIEGPVNSIRWELLRDGIEDYEYFWTLQQQVDQLTARPNLTAAQKTWLERARTLLIVPASISVSTREYTTDASLLMNRRAEIATAIVAGRQWL